MRRYECRARQNVPRRRPGDNYNFFIFEVVKAHVAPTPKHPETLPYSIPPA
jgi:hypothetical protein